MTLNDVMTLTLRYYIEFGKPAFQHITASVRIELTDQKSASVTRRAVKFACVTKCINFERFSLLIYPLSFALSFLFLF